MNFTNFQFFMKITSFFIKISMILENSFSIKAQTQLNLYPENFPFGKYFFKNRFPLERQIKFKQHCTL